MQEIENIENFEQKYSRRLPYTVPEGYFDELPSRIQEYCLAHGNKQTEQRITIWQTLKTQLSLAAGFMALVFMALTGYYILQTTHSPTGVLSNDNYIEVIQYDFTFFEDECTNKSPWIKDTTQNNKDEIIQYLLDQNIDYTTLIE